MARRGPENPHAGSTAPIEVITGRGGAVVLDERGHPVAPDEEPPTRRPGARVVAGVIAVLAALAVIGGLIESGSDDADPIDPIGPIDPGADGSRSDAVPGGGGVAAGDLTVVVVPRDDVVSVTVTSDRPEPAPWVSFEICAIDPPGCVPLWTLELTQEGSTYVADLRVPSSFVSPGGYRHVCVDEPGCELRVISESRSVTVALGEEIPFSPGAGDAPDEVDAPEPAVGSAQVTVSPSIVPEGGEIVVDVQGAPETDVVVRACPADVTRCPELDRGRTDAGGSARFAVRVARLMAVRTPGPDDRWPVVDCAREPCEIRVEGGAGTGTASLAFATPAEGTGSVSFPEMALSPSTNVGVGTIVTVQGTDFVVPVDSRSNRGGWILCERRPTTLSDVPGRCTTPRIVRFPVISPGGALWMVITAPDPAAARTWVGNEAIDCRERCWLGLLADTFPQLVMAPITYG